MNRPRRHSFTMLIWRHVVTKWVIDFSFDLQMGWFKLCFELELHIYLPYKQVLKIIWFYMWNMPMNSQDLELSPCSFFFNFFKKAVSILRITFSYDIGLRWFKLIGKLDSKVYISYKYNVKMFPLDPSNQGCTNFVLKISLET
jgi:hypothetical protein